MTTDQKSVPDTSSTYIAILGELRTAVIAAIGGASAPEDVRDDVDIFGAADELVPGRLLDSLNVVEIIASIEDEFNCSLAPLAEEFDELTLRDIVMHLEQATR